jgi:DNA polymerase elongation subunit (family B)
VPALKVLLFDIETAPMLAYIWNPAEQYVTMDRLIEDTFILNWGAKWWGKDGVTSHTVTKKEALARDDTRLVRKLGEMIRQADVIVGHNVNSFDLPKLNGRLLVLGEEPVGPVRTVDTRVLSKKNFGLAYNKLDYLGQALGLGRKIKTDFDLWRESLQGNTKALRQLAEYNVQDVLLLEKVFDKIAPYVRNMPRLFEAEREGQRACPYCGNEALQPRKYYRTQASTFTQYQCGVCGKYSRARTTERRKKLGVHPL